MGYQQKDYGSSGAMFARQKRTNNSPDVGGDFDLTGDELAYVLANARQGKVKLQISGWRKQGQKGPFTSVKISIPMEQRQTQQQPQYQPRPGARTTPEYDQPDRGLPGHVTMISPNGLDIYRGPAGSPEQGYPVPINQYAQARNEYPSEQERRPGYPPREVYRTAPTKPIPQQTYEEFAKGDRMPDFGGDDDAPPF